MPMSWWKWRLIRDLDGIQAVLDELSKNRAVSLKQGWMVSAVGAPGATDIGMTLIELWDQKYSVA